MLWWFVARHVIFMRICWSIYADMPRGIPPACYAGGMDGLRGPLAVPDDWSHLVEPFYRAEGIVCWYDGVRFAFLYCLLFLQVLLMMCFVLIVRVAVRALKGRAVEDDRSDDEDGGTGEGEGERHDGKGNGGKNGGNANGSANGRGEHEGVVRRPADMARQRTAAEKAK